MIDFQERLAHNRTVSTLGLLKGLQIRCECWYIPYLPQPMREDEYLERKAMLTILLEQLEEEYNKTKRR